MQRLRALPDSVDFFFYFSERFEVHGGGTEGSTESDNKE